MKRLSAKKAKVSVLHGPSDHFFVRHPFVVPVVTFIMIFFVGLATYVSFGGQTVGAADKRIVEVFYDGKRQTLPTRSKTVGDLLQKISVTVGPKDVVEPSIDAPIVEDNFKINVYRARAVEVIDGSNKTIVQTATKSPKIVAKEAGLQLVKEDTATFVQPDQMPKGPLVAEKLVVQRSIPIKVSLYGTVGSYRTLAKTIDEFLKEKGITLKDGETTQPQDRSAPLTEGTFLIVNLPGKQILSVEEPIAFSVQKKNNPALAAGQEKLLQAGAAGKRAVMYEIASKDGIEVGRRALQTIVLVDQTPEIREIGTLAAATYSVSSDKAAIMAAAGIDPSQFASVDYIISKESNWRPGAINSGGCIGLAQRCPSGGTNALVAQCPAWQTDPVCQLRHFSGYANGRYGSWNAAYQVWVVQRWW